MTLWISSNSPGYVLKRAREITGIDGLELHHLKAKFNGRGRKKPRET